MSYASDAASKYESAENKYENAVSQYTGNTGYENALSEGQSGAQQAATGAAASAQGSARTSGMTKSQAAAMGNQSTINSYNSNLANQQNLAYQSGIANTQAQATNLSSEQTEAQNEYTRNWGNLSNILGMVGGGISSLSDARLKNYKKVSGKYFETKEQK